MCRIAFKRNRRGLVFQLLCQKIERNQLKFIVKQRQAYKVTMKRKPDIVLIIY